MLAGERLWYLSSCFYWGLKKRLLTPFPPFPDPFSAFSGRFSVSRNKSVSILGFLGE
jgi:hypothetical protein